MWILNRISRFVCMHLVGQFNLQISFLTSDLIFEHEL